MEASDVFIAIAYLGLLSFIIAKSKFFRIPFAKKSLSLILWAVKVMATLSFLLIYSLYEPYQKGNDSRVYFSDGLVLHETAKTNPDAFLRIMFGKEYSQDEKIISKMNYWNRSYDSVVPNDNRTIIRINVLMHFVSFGNYMVHLLLMSFFSFIGLMALYKSVVLMNNKQKWISIIPVFLIPSTIFWSSGNIKEPILVFALGMSVWYFFKTMSYFKISRLLLFLAYMILLFTIKSYVLFLLIPIMMGYLISKRTNKIPVWAVYSLSYLFMISLGLLVAYIKPSYSFVHLIYTKNLDFINMVNTFHSGSTFAIPNLESSFVDIMLNTPLAIFNALSRPWIWEADIWPKLLAAIENVFLILAMAYLIYKIDFRKSIRHSFFWFCLIFAISLLALSGLVTPNMGALVRYKSPALPFLFIALSMFGEKWIFVEQRIQRLFKL
ncbi:MAG: hypothetical protein RBS19_06435 [Bacteroidales bacterium]|nr:hypothetical protein [Bacteroidales bacterium]MDY0216573.1 hypothetical protein [Bacteroidales bacterium]